MAISEFPHLAIDDFRLHDDRPTPELCFLTHMHEDHTVGLARKSYHGPVVYCTGATKALVLGFRANGGRGGLKYNHLRGKIGGKEILHALDLDRPYVLDYPGAPLQVTLLDANHCPGAAMILVQARGGPSVLFTGDVRCERWHLDAVAHNPALFAYSRRLGHSPARQWLSLYVDDTFLSHRDPLKPYPDNYDGILRLAALLKQYPAELHFCLADRTTGYEEVLIALSQQLHTGIHMDKYFFAMYSAAAKTSPLAAKLIECSSVDVGDNGATRLHYCFKHHGCPMREPHAPTVYFKPCNQPSQQDVSFRNMQLPFGQVRPSALVPFQNSTTIFLGPDQRYYKHAPSKKYYPLNPWFFFSRHSSFPELQGLCNLFHVSSVRSLGGTQIATLALPQASSLKRSHSMTVDSSPSSRPSPAQSSPPPPPKQQQQQLAEPRTEPGSSTAVPAHKAASITSGMFPMYKKQIQARARHKREQQKRRSDNDDETDSDESERHQVLALLNRRAVREESMQKWRATILESQKQLESRTDTQEFDENHDESDDSASAIASLGAGAQPASEAANATPQFAADPVAQLPDTQPVNFRPESMDNEAAGTVPDEFPSSVQTFVRISAHNAVQEDAAQDSVQDPVLDAVRDGAPNGTVDPDSSLLSPPPSPCTASQKRSDGSEDHLLCDSARLGDEASHDLELELDVTHVAPAPALCNDDNNDSNDEGSVIDETPTAESLLAVLEHQIRTDPGCWFSFSFDFARASC